MERWRGVPENLDSALTWTDGKSFKILKHSLFNYWLVLYHVFSKSVANEKVSDCKYIIAGVHIKIWIY